MRNSVCMNERMYVGNVCMYVCMYERERERELCILMEII